MPRILLLLVALAVPAAASAAVPAGIPLWEGAETGMSAEGVLRAFPEARRVPEDERAEQRGPQGGELRVTIQRVELGPDPYTAQFYFREAGLERVVLDRHLEGGMRFSRGLRIAGRVRDALTQTYGEPVRRETGSEGYLVEWHPGDKAVRLVVVTKSYQVKGFQVIFEPLAGD